MTEILPCPFCGTSQVRQKGDKDDRWAWCKNQSCPIYDVEIKDTAWNTRPSPWRDIASAPKDGTWLLLSTKEGIEIGSWITPFTVEGVKYVGCWECNGG